jgi:hypothetical protein
MPQLASSEERAMTAMNDVFDTVMPHYGRRERLEVKAVAEIVCAELGLAQAERKRRKAVEERIKAAYLGGRRQPLYLVDAGLEA